MMEAFYSEQAGYQLYQIHYAGTRDEGYVLCHPAPQDMMRAQYSQTLLARRLQSLGFPVLRFDYAGTGDSSGTIQTLEGWLDDTLKAIATFRKQNGLKRLHIIGTRLGASLALLASQEIGFQRIILWDPVLNGQALLDQYKAAHRLLLHRVPDEAPFPDNQLDPLQSCGFPWPASMQESLAQLHFERLRTYCKDLVCIQSVSTPETELAVNQWRADGSEVQVIQLEDGMHWGDERYMKIQAFPAATLRLLADLAEGKS